MEGLPSDFVAEFNTLKSKVQRLEKAFRKLKKELMAPSDKKPREPSGFAKPTGLSSDLCDFLDIPVGSELARTEVTKRVLKYVKDNNLQNPEKKRELLIDDKMKKLLKPEKDEVVTYFNIQRLLKVHYVKKTTETVVTPSVVETTSKPKTASRGKTKKN
tara:strand:+ start:24527 stop:25003 length:477 start_codon:yes stop_codon:yes gene_type:complete